MRFPYIRTIPAADIEIPVELTRLYDLAYNLWWTWQPRAHSLFATIDPVRWAHDPNPVELLINLEPHRWEGLLVNENFMASYNAVIQEFDRYTKGVGAAWFRQTHPEYDAGPFAYFSAEFGWHESLGIYSGGLGILSGDHCKAASDMGLPFVAVGLMYRRGYFRQTIDADGHQQHLYPDFDVRRLPVLPVTFPNGRRVRVSVELPDRDVHLRLWKATVGRVPVILLDSDCLENHPADRPITSVLYVRGREMRLCQEIVLGIGGVLALRALGVEPAVWHINEGHSALLILRRIRDLIEHEGRSFQEAAAEVRKNTIFTTHTPVPAGNEAYDLDLVRKYFTSHAQACGISLDELLQWGRAHPDHQDGSFNLTALAIRGSCSTNGVSELHGQVASALWRHLWPAEAGPRPIGFITNGVHIPTWMGPEMAELLRRRLGDRFDGWLFDPAFATALEEIPDAELWEAHAAQKLRLVLFVRQRMLNQFARHGRSPDELRAVQSLLDPSALTVGFARRFATYKRAALIFQDLDRLRAILANAQRPVQLLFAGKAHPADRPGQDLIRAIFQASLSPEFRGRIVFLENYNIRIARHLVQGVDLWLNTPRRPQEASGTSGMKAAINGGLNFSVMDGWWSEGYDPEHGWVIGQPKDYDDAGAQDREDAASLYSVLADEIVPCFYDRDPETRLPIRWIRRMKRAIGSLAPRFTAARLIRDYTETYYLPVGQSDTPRTLERYRSG